MRRVGFGFSTNGPPSVDDDQIKVNKVLLGNFWEEETNEAVGFLSRNNFFCFGVLLNVKNNVGGFNKTRAAVIIEAKEKDTSLEAVCFPPISKTDSSSLLESTTIVLPDQSTSQEILNVQSVGLKNLDRLVIGTPGLKRLRWRTASC